MRYDQPFFVPHRMAKRLGWAHAGYLHALEQPEPIEPKPTLPPAIDYFLIGRMAYTQHQVDSLKKGFHTHKKRKTSTPPPPSYIYGTVAEEKSKEEDTPK